MNTTPTTSTDKTITSQGNQGFDLFASKQMKIIIQYDCTGSLIPNNSCHIYATSALHLLFYEAQHPTAGMSAERQSILCQHNCFSFSYLRSRSFEIASTIVSSPFSGCVHDRQTLPQTYTLRPDFSSAKPTVPFTLLCCVVCHLANCLAGARQDHQWIVLRLSQDSFSGLLRGWRAIL